MLKNGIEKKKHNLTQSKEKKNGRCNLKKKKNKKKEKKGGRA